jgi:hypothetical protein
LKPAKKDLLYWKSKTTLSGPKASLILLINSDVEIYNSDFEEIINYLIKYNYTLVSNFSNYNKQNNPHWDGSHNDYLFLHSDH